MDNEKIPENTISSEPQGGQAKNTEQAKIAVPPYNAEPVHSNINYGANIYAHDNNTQNTGGKHKPPRKKRCGVRIFVAVMLALCLFGGAVFGTLVVAPNLDRISEQLFGGAEKLPENTPEEKPQITPEAPEIGGPPPQLYPSNKGEFVQIAKMVGPAVVGITTSVDRRVGRQTREIVIGSGSGFIIKSDGYIATNHHVISEGDYINVTLHDGTEYRAELIGSDEISDIAVIKIDAQGLTAVALGDSDALEVGEKVIAIGNPLGENAGSVTSGIVSGLNREIEGFSLKYIQTDAAINPGNSGGPLVDMDGRVVGINTLKYFLIGTEGLGYAIPISTAKPIIQQLIATGRIPRPFIGIECVVDTLGEYNPVDEAPLGVTVVTVIKGGPADKARIAPRDIILSVDGVKTETIQELLDIINSKQVGDKLNMTVWRSGQEYITTVIIGDKNEMK